MDRLKYCKFHIFHLLLSLMAVVATGLYPLYGNAGENPGQIVVVLDPGHGGSDEGAKGLENHTEKTAVLALSIKIMEKLADAYTVYMTRTDDYDINCFDRISAANHLKADIYLSVHAGGAFLRQTRGITVFYFNDPGRNFPGKSHNVSPAMPLIEESPVKWDDIQYRHIARSKKLAEIFETVFSEKGNPVRVQSAPLITLRGADMPAVMIEFGYITNPTDENALFDPNRMDEYAEMVRNALDRFFEKSSSDVN